MATVAETQAYLDEAKAPSLQTPSATKDAVKTAVVELSQWERQVAYLAQLLKDAEITEPDEEIRQLFEEGAQSLRGMRRVLSELEDRLRILVRTGRVWKDWDTRLREKCAEKGYTI